MWSQRAEAGDPIAQFNLGYCHEMGQGTPVDHEAAFRWYLRAARQGYPRAQYHVGLAFSFGGQGVDWDLTEACKWLTLAAKNGIREAEELLRHSQLPTENRILGEQAAKLFQPKPEPRHAIVYDPDLILPPPADTGSATQLGLGF
jgi:TPR repeat protein